MKFLKTTARSLLGGARKLGAGIYALSGGITVSIDDLPVSSAIVESITLIDVEKWMRNHLVTMDDATKLAVVRERHGNLWKIAMVLLTNRNRRARDADGKPRALVQLVRKIAPELEEFFADRNTVLLVPADLP